MSGIASGKGGVRVDVGGGYYFIRSIGDGTYGYFDEKNRPLVGPPNEFAQKVLIAMNLIGSISDYEISGRLYSVLNSDKIITISDGYTNEFNSETGDLMWTGERSSQILLDNGGSIYTSGKMSNVGRDADLNLAHELLGHGYQWLFGDLNYNERIEWRENGKVISRIPVAEADASNITSRVAIMSGRPGMYQPAYQEPGTNSNGGKTFLYHMVPMNFNLYDRNSMNPRYFRRWP